MMLDSDEARIRRAASGQAESELIGTLLFDDGAIDEIGRLIKPEHFASDRLRIVYETLLRLRRDDRSASPEAVAAELGTADGLIDDLIQAVNLVSHSVHVDHYAVRVLDDFKRRSFRTVANSTSAELKRVDANVDETLNHHVQQIAELLDGSTETDGHIAEHMLAADESTPIEQITTGLWDLDVLLDGGFAAGQLICIGARPSVGKTAFSSGLALAAAQAEVPTLFLSLEMTGGEMTSRIQRQFNACGPDNIDRLNQLANLPLFVREAAGWSIDRLECEARRYARRHAVKVVVVDYLSLVRSRDTRIPRHEQVADISRSLKLLAIKTGLAVVAAQQLSREIEKRADRRPQMSDFRESGSIEQDSDILIGLDRPVRPDEGDREAARLFIMKHRNGETGNLNLRFDPRRTLFTESKLP